MNVTTRRYYFIRSQRDYAALCKDLRAAGVLTVECIHRSKPDATVTLRLELPERMTGNQIALKMWDGPWSGTEVREDR